MRRLFVFLVLLASPACDGCEDEGFFTPSGPSNIVSIRIEGPSQLLIGQTANYRAFGRAMGSEEQEITTQVSWNAEPRNRVTLGVNGAATGASEGLVNLSAFITGAALQSIPVNVVAPSMDPPPPPPTSPTPTPPPTTPTREVQVECPSTITLDEIRRCEAYSVVNGVRTRVTPQAAFSGDGLFVAAVTGDQIRGVNVGSGSVTATFEGTSGRAQVTVVAGANGEFDVTFVPVSNSCSFGIRAVRTGTMSITFASGTLILGEERQSYALTYAVSGGRVQMAGTSSANGFQYSMELSQAEPGSSRYTGRETIAAPQGCGALYTVTLERRR